MSRMLLTSIVSIEVSQLNHCIPFHILLSSTGTLETPLYSQSIRFSNLQCLIHRLLSNVLIPLLLTFSDRLFNSAILSQ